MERGLKMERLLSEDRFIGARPDLPHAASAKQQGDRKSSLNSTNLHNPGQLDQLVKCIPLSATCSQ
jgi:hypothetical protein